MRALNVKHVQITCDGLYGRIVVDDQVLTLLLAGYELAHTAGKVPQVGLHAGPAASLSSLSAWPVPLSPNRGDPGPAVAVFLRATTPPN